MGPSATPATMPRLFFMSALGHVIPRLDVPNRGGVTSTVNSVRLQSGDREASCRPDAASG